MDEKRISNEVDEIMAFIHKGNNFLLSGGAGSGKTYTLVQVINRVATEAPTAQIACITYTNAAAIEIRNRVSTLNLKVSTIHDFLWDNISPFQKEMKKTLLELLGDPNSLLKLPYSEGQDSYAFENGIQYKEYVRLERGEISHDEVIILANEMYKNYMRLCDLIKDSFQFIFVDEYQDTSPLVIEILLNHISKSRKSNVIGFFGDAMQSIYESGVGNIDPFVQNGQVCKVEKTQNRRNPKMVIKIANKLRTDGLIQEPSNDITAPNMVNGLAKEGSVNFLYSSDFDINLVKSSTWCTGWDFSDSKKTKELRLTHNLIATEAGFVNLMAIYDADPICKFKRDFKSEVKNQGILINADDTFDSVVSSVNWAFKIGSNAGKQHIDVLLEDTIAKELYEYVRTWPYHKVQKIYLDKDNLIDDKVVIDGITTREPKRDKFIQHLFKIQEIVALYQKKQYNELLQKTSFKISSISDKKMLKDKIIKLMSFEDSSIESVIDYADMSGLCIIDDKLKNFLRDNEYLYWRAKNIPFREVQNLYNYLEGYVPLSTQHKIKGREYNNVLVILHNGGWSNYNFEYLLDETICKTLSASRQKSYPGILLRTKKLFYVCCTRAKENLVVYYPQPSKEVIAGAIALFGEENCINLDS